MSKSYKKNPIAKERLKGGKKEANKRVRKSENFSLRGNSYRKVSESYDVCEFRTRWTKEDAIRYYNNRTREEYYSHSYVSKKYCAERVREFLKRYPTVETFLQYWEKEMRRKIK